MNDMTVVTTNAALASLPEGRRQLIEVLKREGELDAEALATRIGVTPSGVRQHLVALERDGLVLHRSERSGPGRPRHQYALTQAGDAFFPRRYEDLTNELLAYVDDEDPDLLRKIFLRRSERRLVQAQARIEGLSHHDTIAEIAKILDEDGYLADFVPGDDGSYVIREHNCAVLGVALRYGHACGTELAFLQALLPDATVTRIAHRVAGHHYCAYEVRTLVDE